MKKVILIALFLISVASSAALACPAGTHPVCVYDPYLGRSVCRCVHA